MFLFHLWFPLGLALAGPPSIDEPLRLRAQATGDAAVVIGIEDYAFIPDVPFAKRDAKAVYDFLLYTRGVPSSRIRLLNQAPSREKILEAVDAAAALVGPHGTLWVTFAGHGAASPEVGERMLLGVDVQAELSSFSARSISVPELRKRASANGGRVLLILDTCYTGQGRSGADLLAGKRFAVPTYATVADPTIVEWTAAAPNQFSGPLEGAQHGAFTWAVLGALRGWADGQMDGERDGAVTLEEARFYVQDALLALQVADQTPGLLATEDALSWALTTGSGLEEAPLLSVDGPGPAPARPQVLTPEPAVAAHDADAWRAEVEHEREMKSETQRLLNEQVRRDLLPIDQTIGIHREQIEQAVSTGTKKSCTRSVFVHDEFVRDGVPVSWTQWSCLPDDPAIAVSINKHQAFRNTMTVAEGLAKVMARPERNPSEHTIYKMPLPGAPAHELVVIRSNTGVCDTIPEGRASVRG